VVRGKEPLEGVGFEAFCLDTEGNMFSVIHDEGLSALLPPTQA
jgi:predicted enzyme related to lactoylglutathione lyase